MTRGADVGRDWAAAEGWRAVVRRAALVIDGWHWLILLLAAPLLLFPSPSRALALLIPSGLWLAAWLAGRPPLPRTPFNAALLLLSVTLLISLGATYSVTVSLPKIAGLLLGLAVFFAAARYTDETRQRAVVFVTVMAGAGLSLFGILGTRWPVKYIFLTRAAGLLPAWLRGLPGAPEGLAANEVAGALLWYLPLELLLAYSAWRQPAASGRRWAWRLFCTVNLLLGVLVLFLTQSRMALFGLAATVGLAALIAAVRRFGRLVWVPLALAAVAMMVWLPFYGFDHLLKVVPLPPAGETAGFGTLAGRIVIWSNSVQIIEFAPLTGIGLNTFRIVYPMLFPKTFIGLNFDLAHAHNEFLQAAVEFGLPGLVAFLALHLVAAGLVWRLVRPGLAPAGSNAQMAALALACGAGLLAHSIYAMADAVALGAKPGFTFWLLLGLLAGLSARAARPSTSQP